MRVVVGNPADIYSGVHTENLKKFLTKVLYRAICDFVNYKKSRNNKGKQLFEEANIWIYGPEPRPEDSQPPPDDEHPPCWTLRELSKADQYMSFATICDILGWDTGWVRERIGRLTRADLQHIGKNGVL